MGPRALPVIISGSYYTQLFYISSGDQIHTLFLTQQEFYRSGDFPTLLLLLRSFPAPLRAVVLLTVLYRKLLYKDHVMFVYCLLLRCFKFVLSFITFSIYLEGTW